MLYFALPPGHPAPIPASAMPAEHTTLIAQPRSSSKMQAWATSPGHSGRRAIAPLDRAQPEFSQPEFSQPEFSQPGSSPSGWLAQAIVPAADGTNTVTTPSGNQTDISGGRRSGDGANLFHSFSRFGLSNGQIANFLSSPEIRNILTRVVGGEASVINGRLQVSGGNSNLFLLNPAGIVFGTSASLNVPAAFTATTASTIGWGSEAWGVGSGNFATGYDRLTGDPTGFVFAGQPGVILNAGNLAVAPGQSLNLLGGSVINTGQLTAPGGEITIAAIAPDRRIRLTQPGSLLSFEIEALPSSSVSLPAPASLPQLLTGGDVQSATGVMVNANGELVLTGTPIPMAGQAGAAIVSGRVDVSSQVNSGQADGSGAANPIGGTVQVLGDRVGVFGAEIAASGAGGGGTVRLGGEYQGRGGVPTARQTIVSPGTVIRANAEQQGNGGRVIVWADDTTSFHGTIAARGASTHQPSNGGFAEVSGRNYLIYRGTVDLSAPNGTIGTLLLDPIDISIVSAPTGSEDAFLPNISAGAGPPTTFTISANALQSQTAAIVLEATNNIVVENGLSLNFVPGAGSITFRADADNSGAGSFLMDSTQTLTAPGRSLTISGATIALGAISTSQITATGTAAGGNVTLSATGAVSTGAISTIGSAGPTGIPATATGGNIAITAGSIATTTLNTNALTSNPTPFTSSATAGNVTLTSTNGNITFGSITARGTSAQTTIGGTVQVSANGVVQGTGGGDTITTDSGPTSGPISIQHTGGPQNLPFTVGSASGNGVAGALNAGTQTIATGSFPVLPNGGVAPGTGTPNPITITSVNQAPSLTLNSNLPATAPGQPVSFTYSDLAPQFGDANNDQITLLITAVNGTLTVNGTIAVPGSTTLSPGDVLVYTPPANATGAAFSVSASDGVAQSTPSVQVFPTLASSPTPPVPPGFPEQIARSPSTARAASLASVLLPSDTPAPLTTRSLDADAIAQLPCTTDAGVAAVDDRFRREYEDYTGQSSNTATRSMDACAALNQIQSSTGVKPAIVYVSFAPGSLTSQLTTQASNSDTSATKSLAQATPGKPPARIPATPDRAANDQLELILVTQSSRPIYKRISATRAQVLQVARQFSTAITDPITRESDTYLAPAQQLYRWLVQPLAADLKAQNIQNLVFIMDAGLRSLSIAALHDGQQFLIEQYSLGLMPSLSLTDPRYRDIRQSDVLAMGAATFTDQRPLPAVPVELSTIRQNQWPGSAFLNEEFTLNNLKAQRQRQPFGIIHLATHAEFKPGNPSNSYIQLWDTRLRLDQVRQLGWSSPPVQLLVLSACRTAIGDEQAELGFAGLAYQTGVRSALASLWAVDDQATLALMTEFYHHLKTDTIKAEALRQTQLAMLRQQVRVEQGNLLTSAGTTALPPEIAQQAVPDLSAPYYWAGFTLVGNPW